MARSAEKQFCAFVREKQIYTSRRKGEQMKEVEIFVQTEGRKAYYKSGRRRKRRGMTTPSQAALNDRNAAIAFDRIANTNFGLGDYHVTLTYDNAQLPETVAQAEEHMKRYCRRLAALYKKNGLKLKYMFVTACRSKEQSSRSESFGVPVRIHHHLLISGGVDRDSIEKLWCAKSSKPGKLGEKLGAVNCDRLQPDGNGISALCTYLSKQPREGVSRRWHSSIGLEKPLELAPNDDKYDFADLMQIVKDNADFPNRAFWERQYKGWTLQNNLQYAYTVVFSELSGYSIRVKLRKLTETELKERKLSKYRVKSVG